jgi:hypothetical protein
MLSDLASSEIPNMSSREDLNRHLLLADNARLCFDCCMLGYNLVTFFSKLQKKLFVR